VFKTKELILSAVVAAASILVHIPKFWKVHVHTWDGEESACSSHRMTFDNIVHAWNDRIFALSIAKLDSSTMERACMGT
jgi:hypothetical protein